MPRPTRLSRPGKPVAKDLATRTPGEELWARRRLQGLTGPQAAEKLGVGRTALWQAEGDGPAAPHLAQLARVLWRQPPGLPQLLALARRRQGVGVFGVARMVGCSHVTLLKKERAGDEGLKAFWEKRGFTFVRRRG